MVDREQETIVIADRGRGPGTIVVIVLGVLALLLASYLALGDLTGGADMKGVTADADVTPPTAGKGT